MQEIEKKYIQLGGEAGTLGPPTSGYDLNPDQVGFRRHYKHGSIYWHPDTRANMIFGSIRKLWSNPHREELKEGETGGRDGWEQGLLGYPLTDETATPDHVGAYSHFQRGSIYSHPVLGTWRLQGIIRDIWAREGWERSKYGYPISDTDLREDKLTHFGRFQHGDIEWFPHEALAAIQVKYNAYGAASGQLGQATEDFKRCPDGIGYYQHFEHGCIYWQPKFGAVAVFEPIRQKWGELEWERGLLGYPIRDESSTPGGAGRICAFQKEGGYIYWKTGSDKAFEVHGNIGKQYADMGWEQSRLGFPVSDEMDADGSDFQRASHFEGGHIYWGPDRIVVL